MRRAPSLMFLFYSTSLVLVGWGKVLSNPTNQKKRMKVVQVGFYSLASTIFAMGAFFFTDSIPLTHASFDE